MEQTEPLIAFAATHEPPALEIRVNFGVFAGRDTTAAEIDELAKMLLPEVPEISIVSEQRHEVSEEIEVSLHQVRIEVATEHLPTDAEELDALRERLVSACETWAWACIEDRHAEVTEL
jgi:hypothetical protein